MPGSSGSRVARDDVRLLVRLQADAVAGAVDEVLAVAGRGDDVAGGGVDRLGGDAGPYGVARRRAGRAAAPRSSRANVGGRLADGVGAGGVGAVAVGQWCRRCRRRPGRRCWMTRSDTSWCGLAPLGPEATMTKSTVAWPAARIASAMSRATSRSVRPARSHSRHLRGAPGRCAAPASRSAADLARATCASAAPAARRRPAPARRRAARRGSAATLHRPHAVVDGRPGRTSPQPAGDERVRVLGLVPGDEVEAEPGGGRGLARPAAPGAGTTRNGSAGGRHHQARQPLQRLGVVAGEVAQVRAGRQQQRVQARVGGGLAGEVESLRRVQGCCGVGHDSYRRRPWHRPQSLP